MSYSSTGGESTASAQTKPMGRLIDLNVGDNQATSAYQPIGRDRSDAAAVQAIEPVRTVGPSRPRKKTDPKAKQRRNESRRWILRATTEAESMIAAAEIGEFTLVSNFTYKLRDTLQNLWDLRADREDDWGDILNTLQIVLERQDVGEFAVDQCKTIRNVIVDHLALQSVDSTDLEECVIALVESGLDPFLGLPSHDVTDKDIVDEEGR